MSKEIHIDLDAPDEIPVEHLTGLRGAILHTLNTKHGIEIIDAKIHYSRPIRQDERDDIEEALRDLSAVEDALGINQTRH